MMRWRVFAVLVRSDVRGARRWQKILEIWRNLRRADRQAFPEPQDRDGDREYFHGIAPPLNLRIRRGLRLNSHRDVRRIQRQAKRITIAATRQSSARASPTTLSPNKKRAAGACPRSSYTAILSAERNGTVGAVEADQGSGGAGVAVGGLGDLEHRAIAVRPASGCCAEQVAVGVGDQTALIA